MRLLRAARVSSETLGLEASLPPAMRYRELVLGAAVPDEHVNLTNNSALTSFGLVTEAYTEIAVSEFNPSNQLDSNIVGGIEFRYNGDQVVIGYDQFDFSSKRIIFRGPPILDRIDFQARTVACSDAQHLSSTVVGYLRLEAGNQVIEIGRTIDGYEEINGLAHRATPVQTLRGKLMIVGAGKHMFSLGAIQVADFTAANTDTELESAIATVAYGRAPTP